MSGMNIEEMARLAQAEARGKAAAEETVEETGSSLSALIANPIYQVRRVLRVTQMSWNLPLAGGRRGRRLARREAPVLSAPRPGLLAGLAAG